MKDCDLLTTITFSTLRLAGSSLTVLFTWHYPTRHTDPLFNTIWVVGLRSAITLIRRCRPVGWLVVSFEVHCVSRTQH
jgi:hypothetical protein